MSEEKIKSRLEHCILIFTDKIAFNCDIEDIDSIYLTTLYYKIGDILRQRIKEKEGKKDD